MIHFAVGGGEVVLERQAAEQLLLPGTAAAVTSYCYCCYQVQLLLPGTAAAAAGQAVNCRLSSHCTAAHSIPLPDEEHAIAGQGSGQPFKAGDFCHWTLCNFMLTSYCCNFSNCICLSCNRLMDLLSFGSLLHTVWWMYVWRGVLYNLQKWGDTASIGIFRFGQDETKSIESGKSVSDSPSLSLTRAFIRSQICGGPIEWQRWNCLGWNFLHQCNAQLWKAIGEGSVSQWHWHWHCWHCHRLAQTQVDVEYICTI